MSDNNDDNVIHISNLSRNVKYDHLKEIFSNYGSVKSIELEIDKRLGFNKGTAYIRFDSPTEAQEAMVRMDGGQIDGLDDVKDGNDRDNRRDTEVRRDFRGPPRERDRYVPPRGRSPSPRRPPYNRNRPDSRDRPYRPPYNGRALSPYRRRSPPRNDYRVNRRSRDRRSPSPVRNRRERTPSVDRKRYSRSRSNNRRRSRSYSSDSSKNSSTSRSRSKSTSSRSSSVSSKRSKSVDKNDKKE
eukprot:gene17716-23308_t